MGYCNREMIMSLFNSLVLSTFEYSCLAFLNMPNHEWNKVEGFLTRSLKSIFDLPRHMNSDVARGIFMSTTFLDKLEKFAVKRAANLLNVCNLTKDMVIEYGNYTEINGRNTILNRMEEICGVENVENLCHLCFFNVEHCCVSMGPPS